MEKTFEPLNPLTCVDDKTDVSDPKLSNEDLIRLYHNGNNLARAELYNRNTGLIRFTINKYGYRNATTTMQEDDLMQEGGLGLLRAIDMYDEDIGKEKDCLFSTYALYWIRQAITRAICNEDSMVRIPVHTRGKYAKAKRLIATQEAWNSLGKRNTEDIKKSALTEAEISQEDYDHIDYLVKIASLNTPITTEDGDSDSELMDFIPSQEDVESVVMRNLLDGDILQLFNSANLDDRERFVLVCRYGLGSQQCPMSLQRTSELLGVTRERVRQIQIKAEKKIRFSDLGKRYFDKKTSKEKNWRSVSAVKCGVL